MSKIIRIIFIISFILVVFSSCSTKQPQEDQQSSNDAISTRPFESAVTFTGVIPCEGCVRVDITLNVLPDTMYQLRKTYVSNDGTATIESQVGKWVYLPKDKLLILGKQKGLWKTYVVVNNNKLLFVEWEGTDNTSQIQYELVRSAVLDPFDDVVKIIGRFRVNGGVGSIMECATETTFPVRSDKDYSTLLQNYMNTPHDQGRPLLASVFAKVVRGKSGRPELLIEQFRKIYPDRNCEGSKIKSSLTGTSWRLLELGGVTLTKSVDAKQVYLLLDSSRSFRAYGGCNKITGNYLVKGDLFSINRKHDIRMACPTGLLLEKNFIEALDSTESFRVEGEILELMDHTDQIRARFKAGGADK